MLKSNPQFFLLCLANYFSYHITMALLVTFINNIKFFFLMQSYLYYHYLYMFFINNAI